MTRKKLFLVALALTVVGLGGWRIAAQQGGAYDVLIRNGQVVDGTGNPYFYADVAVREGSIDELATQLGREVERSVRERFAELDALAGYDPADLSRGRAWVAAYVRFIHHVEGIAGATGTASHLPAKTSLAPHHGHP